MQMIGTLAEAGFTLTDLEAASKVLRGLGCTVEIIPLHHNLPLPSGKTEHDASLHAHILVARGAVGLMIKSSADALFREQRALRVDKKAKMRGRVVNKHARWNLCFGEASQEPDYEQGKGRVVAFSEVPLMQRFRACLPRVLGAKAELLQGELNHYYDKSTTGIGFHGDSERKMVACVRLGGSTPLHYQWFQQGSPVGARVKLTLNHGDFYVMSEKATGCDWKKRIVPTLRHAAGAAKFLRIKAKTT